MRSTVESPKGIIWDLDGARLLPWQAADRLYQGGFTDPLLLAEACSVMKAESGWYLKAWHINAVYNEDGTLKKDAGGRITVKSVDLGFIQKNVVMPGGSLLEPTPEAADQLIDSLFKSNPKLANGIESSKIAFQMYQQRGFQPWYAWVNGFSKQYLDDGALAVGNLCGMRHGEGPTSLMKVPRSLTDAMFLDQDHFE